MEQHNMSLLRAINTRIKYELHDEVCGVQPLETMINITTTPLHRFTHDSFLEFKHTSFTDNLELYTWWL